jgi:hypothetical protein
MSEDDPATRLVNALTECFEAVVPLASTQAWHRLCQTMATEERKNLIFGAVSVFAGSMPLLDLPEVHGPKDNIRRAIPIAAELERLLAVWDGEAEPSAAVMTLACDFLACFELTSELRRPRRPG